MVVSTRRAIRIGNCAGAACDAGYQMLRQCSLGPIDVVTGDYLAGLSHICPMLQVESLTAAAEANLAQNVDNFQNDTHPGYEANAFEGLKLSLEIAAEKGIKLIVNGGALNPEGMARDIRNLGLSLKVAWLTGDDLLNVFKAKDPKEINHLDGDKSASFLTAETIEFLHNPHEFELVSAHAYLGARGIKKALDLGSDIVICGRVSDASPVIGAAWWWHQWDETDYDQLAGTLVAGHLIECSGYGSGGNFCEFFQFPFDRLLDIGFPIAEVYADGSAIITKHEGTRGFVTEEILKAQLLYEIQGNIYLHSDCRADLSAVEIVQDTENRIRVTGTKGFPPPTTTKLAVFYRGGWQCEYVLNGTGYATTEKFQLHEMQIKYRLEAVNQLRSFQVLEFQTYGNPAVDPKSQLSSTAAIRVFGQAKKRETVEALGTAMLHSMLQHYAGMHGTLDWRLLQPKPYMAYCPCLILQRDLSEQIHVMETDGTVISEATGSPGRLEDFGRRLNYDPFIPPSSKFGPIQKARLGDVVLARSGDKGGNLNIGLFVRATDEWDWLRSTLSSTSMKELMADEWNELYKLERVELEGIKAVHFVIYGILKRGVSSSARLDALGKGFAEFIRDRWIDIPTAFLVRYSATRPISHTTKTLLS